MYSIEWRFHHPAGEGGSTERIRLLAVEHAVRRCYGLSEHVGGDSELRCKVFQSLASYNLAG